MHIFSAGKLPRKAKEAVASAVQATTKDVIRGSGAQLFYS